MKQKSKKILKYINDFSWTIDWDSRDYHPESTYGCSGAEKVEKQSFKDDKTLKRTKPCNYKRDHSLGKGKFNGKLELGK